MMDGFLQGVVRVLQLGWCCASGGAFKPYRDQVSQNPAISVLVRDIILDIGLSINSYQRSLWSMNTYRPASRMAFHITTGTL